MFKRHSYLYSKKGISWHFMFWCTDDSTDFILHHSRDFHFNMHFISLHVCIFARARTKNI